MAPLQRERFITSKRYDVTGCDIFRIAKHFFISKLGPYDNFAGGPGRMCLTVLLLMHLFGRVISWTLIESEHRVIATLSGIQNRLRGLRMRLLGKIS